MRLDGRMSGCIDTDQMKKFFIHPTIEHTIWDDAFDVFNLKDKLITFPVSIVLLLQRLSCYVHAHRILRIFILD